MPVFTVGHSNRTLPQLIDVLSGAGVQLLVDVRRYPSSRRNPQFNEGNLRRALAEHAIDYQHQGDALGGHRESGDPSRYLALRDEAMRAYAAHMNTATFRAALAQVITSASRCRLVLMCAERHQHQCHRSLICDFLHCRGVDVEHLLENDSSHPHQPHEHVRLNGDAIEYDLPQMGLF